MGVFFSTIMTPFSGAFRSSSTYSYFFRIDVFGNCTDGDVTISSSVVLSRDMHYRHLTVNGTLDVNNYIVRVRGTCTVNGVTIHANGRGGAGGSSPTTGNGGNGITIYEKIGLVTYTLRTGGGGGFGGGGSGVSGVGGAGGGIVRLYAISLVASGNWWITANGLNGGNGQYISGVGLATSGGGGGGGGGGSILIVVVSTNISTARLVASGGSGGLGYQSSGTQCIGIPTSWNGGSSGGVGGAGNNTTCEGVGGNGGSGLGGGGGGGGAACNGYPNDPPRKGGNGGNGGNSTGIYLVWLR